MFCKLFLIEGLERSPAPPGRRSQTKPGPSSTEPAFRESYVLNLTARFPYPISKPSLKFQKQKPLISNSISRSLIHSPVSLHPRVSISKPPKSSPNWVKKEEKFLKNAHQRDHPRRIQILRDPNRRPRLRPFLQRHYGP